MKNVFIDSNIFIKENYLQGKYINSLLKLGENSAINIFSHDIVIGEVKNNFKIDLEQSLKAYNEFKKKGAKYLRNLKIGKEIVNYNKLILEELYNEFSEELETRLRKAKVKIIPFVKIDVQPIFKDYFDKTLPFSLKKEKKHGFPDAFLIKFITAWVEDQNENLTVLSADNDFNDIDKYHNLIQVQSDHRVFVDQVNKELMREEKLKEFRIQKVHKIIKSNLKDLKLNTIEYVQDYLYDDSIYWPLLNTDIYDLSNLRFEDILNLEIYIVNIVNKVEIAAELSYMLKFKIDILTDDETASVYDSDDKVMYYFEKKKIVAEGICDFNTTVTLSIIDEEDFDESIDLHLTKEDITIEVYSNDEML